jgi:hypothetical protein
MGIAPVAASPGNDPPPADLPSGGSSLDLPTHLEAPAAPAGQPATRTILGVARPGIAPLEPGLKKEALLAPGTYQAAPQPAASYQPAHPPSEPDNQSAAGHQASPYQAALPSLAELPSDTTVSASPISEPPPTLATGGQRGSSRGVPVLAALAVTLAAALFAAGVVVLVLHKGTGPIEGRAVLGADGKERLEISCAECPDGTRIAVGRAGTTLKAQRGTLALPQPLKIGENRLALLLTRPGDRSTSQAELTVPVQYRVRADLTGLAETAPRLRVVVEALPKSRVTVDGKPLSLGPDGRATHDIDISSELAGAETTVKKLERRVPYSVTPPGAATESGQVTFQLGITSLGVEAPGERITIETPTFVLSGKAQRGARVSVADRPITLDAEGRFAQVMSVSSEGETTIVVRASAPDHAPRLYSIHIKRVARLADEAVRLRATALTSYSSLGDGTARKGEQVALDGTLLEHRAEGYASYLLVDVSSGCQKPPCLLRVIHGAPVRLAQGSALSVLGRVTGSVEGARTGTRVPEVFASFLVPGAK